MSYNQCWPSSYCDIVVIACTCVNRVITVHNINTWIICIVVSTCVEIIAIENIFKKITLLLSIRTNVILYSERYGNKTVGCKFDIYKSNMYHWRSNCQHQDLQKECQYSWWHREWFCVKITCTLIILSQNMTEKRARLWIWRSFRDSLHAFFLYIYSYVCIRVIYNENLYEWL